MSYYLKESLKALKAKNAADRAAKQEQVKSTKETELLAEIARLNEELGEVKKTCNYLALQVQHNIMKHQGEQEHYSIPRLDIDKKASGE